jgi:uncharacterized membrane protein YqaE (UPF0057 family)
MSGYGTGPDDPSSPQYPSAPQYDQPSYAGGPDGPAERVPMPPTVHWASIAMIARTAISIIVVLIIFARLDTITDDVLARSGDLDRDAAKAAVVFGAVIALVISLLLLGLAVMVRRGRNWARITAIVLAALGFLGGLLSYAQPYGGALTLLDTVNLLLAIATLVLLLLPQSSAYFKAQRPRA